MLRSDRETQEAYDLKIYDYEYSEISPGPFVPYKDDSSKDDGKKCKKLTAPIIFERLSEIGNRRHGVSDFLTTKSGTCKKAAELSVRRKTNGGDSRPSRLVRSKFDEFVESVPVHQLTNVNARVHGTENFSSKNESVYSKESNPLMSDSMIITQRSDDESNDTSVKDDSSYSGSQPRTTTKRRSDVSSREVDKLKSDYESANRPVRDAQELEETRTKKKSNFATSLPNKSASTKTGKNMTQRLVNLVAVSLRKRKSAFPKSSGSEKIDSTESENDAAPARQPLKFPALRMPNVDPHDEHTLQRLEKLFREVLELRRCVQSEDEWDSAELSKLASQFDRMRNAQPVSPVQTPFQRTITEKCRVDEDGGALEDSPSTTEITFDRIRDMLKDVPSRSQSLNFEPDAFFSPLPRSPGANDLSPRSEPHPPRSKDNSPIDCGIPDVDDCKFLTAKSPAESPEVSVAVKCKRPVNSHPNVKPKRQKPSSSKKSEKSNNAYEFGSTFNNSNESKLLAEVGSSQSCGREKNEDEPVLSPECYENDEIYQLLNEYAALNAEQDRTSQSNESTDRRDSCSLFNSDDMARNMNRTPGTSWLPQKTAYSLSNEFCNFMTPVEDVPRKYEDTDLLKILDSD